MADPSNMGPARMRPNVQHVLAPSAGRFWQARFPQRARFLTEEILASANTVSDAVSHAWLAH